MTNIFLGIKATEVKIWFPNGNSGEPHQNGLWKETTQASESSALQTLQHKLKEIHSEKLTAVYFVPYDGSF